MSRALSAAMYRAGGSRETGEVVLFFVKIDHDDLDDPIYVVSNTEDVVRDGTTWTGLPFEISMPADDPEEAPRVQLRIDNVHRAIVRAVKDLASEPTITLEVALASQPTTIEAGPIEMTLKNARASVLVVEGELGGPAWLDEPWPSETFTPTTHPGMYA